MIDIVIIGAGISGLACAMALSSFSNDINLIVLEASSRIGGRIRTIKTDDGTVLDLGAQFIHGTIENPLFDFAVKRVYLKMLKIHFIKYSSSVEENEVQCFPQGMHAACSEQELKEIFQTASLYVKDFLKKMYMLSDDEVDTCVHKTVGEFMYSMFTSTSAEIKGNQNLLNLLKSVFMNWAFLENISSGCKSVFDMDLRGFLSYAELKGEPFVEMSTQCAHGYEAIINEIVKDINTDCIKLNCEVNKIDNVIIDGISKIKISCNNSKEFFADTCILTVSVGVLKQFVKNNTFLLDLPEKKLSSIEKVHLANVGKIFFKFITPIKDDISFFTFFQPPELLDSGTFHCDCPLLERIGSSDWWLLWLVCDDTEFKADDTADYLNDILQSYSSIYPNLPDNKVDRDNIITIDWRTNKYFRGSYTYLKPGTDQDDIANLAEPLSYGRANLLFAGEACSEEFFSTTHGAYLSGIREAENVKSKYNISQPFNSEC